MDFSSPETWRWIWLVAAVALAVGEISAPGTFFMFAFALGAGGAAVIAFLSVSVWIEWLVFVGVSAAGLAALRPLARRIEASEVTAKVGAHRWEGREAVVVREIPRGLHESGLVRVDREEWRAETTNGTGAEAGSTVLVVRVAGTRLVVAPLHVDLDPGDLFESDW